MVWPICWIGFLFDQYLIWWASKVYFGHLLQLWSVSSAVALTTMKLTLFLLAVLLFGNVAQAQRQSATSAVNQFFSGMLNALQGRPWRATSSSSAMEEPSESAVLPIRTITRTATVLVESNYWSLNWYSDAILSNLFKSRSQHRYGKGDWDCRNRGWIRHSHRGEWYFRQVGAIARASRNDPDYEHGQLNRVPENDPNGQENGKVIKMSHLHPNHQLGGIHVPHRPAAPRIFQVNNRTWLSIYFIYLKNVSKSIQVKWLSNCTIGCSGRDPDSGGSGNWIVIRLTSLFPNLFSQKVLCIIRWKRNNRHEMMNRASFAYISTHNIHCPI